jgi:hypothetical protein
MIFRRQVLGTLAGGLFSRVFAESYPSFEPCGGAARSEVKRLLDANPSRSHVSAKRAKYTASATVTLLSFPIISRSGVGSGYAVVEEAECPRGRGISIQFGAGSWPEAARGLNRFGIIHEVAVEKQAFENRNGDPEECAYFAFMTTSPEKAIAQAKQALASSADSLPCVTAQGRGGGGSFASHVEALDLPSRLTWRDADKLAARVHEATAKSPCVRNNERGAAATFLYSVRKAMLDVRTERRSRLFFNSKQFLLETRKERDPVAGARLAERRLVANKDHVMRLRAMLTNLATGHQTPFHLWYEAGSEEGPPLRFEYQAKSFLRLTFEADPAAPEPLVPFVLGEKQA